MDKPNRIFFFLHNKKRLKLFKCVREGTEIKSEENQIEREKKGYEVGENGSYGHASNQIVVKLRERRRHVGGAK